MPAGRHRASQHLPKKGKATSRYRPDEIDGDFSRVMAFMNEFDGFSDYIFRTIKSELEFE